MLRRNYVWLLPNGDTCCVRLGFGVPGDGGMALILHKAAKKSPPSDWAYDSQKGWYEVEVDE